MISPQPAGKKRIFESNVARLRHGEREPMHTHEQHAQLKWPTTGLLRVQTADGVFVIPPTRALWIPAGQPHAGAYLGEVVESSLYVHRDYCDAFPLRCALVVLSDPLARVIMATQARLSEYASADQAARDQLALAELRSELRDTGLPALPLRFHADARLQPALDALRECPQDERSAADWARLLKMSPRTLGRLFQQQTGMSFGHFRKRVRLLYALERLAGGVRVAQVAEELGYGSDSAFIYMFRRALGVTPRRCYDQPA